MSKAGSPASIRQRLVKHGLRAQKSLGQHFLIEEEAVAKIIEAAKIESSATVVEVGPGPGVLTPALCETAKKVIAIELDEKILSILRGETRQYPNLAILQGDVLTIDPGELPRPYQVVANIPYYITSLLLRHFLESHHHPESMTLTVQAEVAERIVSRPPKMSLLAVSVQLYGVPQIIDKIPRTSFWPVPEVDSAVLRIDQIRRGLAERLGGQSEADLFAIVRAGFGEKRKQVHNSLARNLDLSHQNSIAILERAAIEPSRRAETLTVADWIALTKAWKKISNA